MYAIIFDRDHADLSFVGSKWDPLAVSFETDDGCVFSMDYATDGTIIIDGKKYLQRNGVVFLVTLNTSGNRCEQILTDVVALDANAQEGNEVPEFLRKASRTNARLASFLNTPSLDGPAR